MYSSMDEKGNPIFQKHKYKDLDLYLTFQYRVPIFQRNGNISINFLFEC